MLLEQQILLNKECVVNRFTKVLFISSLLIAGGVFYQYFYQEEPENSRAEARSDLPTTEGPDRAVTDSNTTAPSKISAKKKAEKVLGTISSPFGDRLPGYVKAELNEINQVSNEIIYGLEKTGLNDSNYDELLNAILDGDMPTAVAFFKYMEHCRRFDIVPESDDQEDPEKWCGSSKRFLDKRNRQGLYSVTDILSVYEQLAHAGGQLEQISYVNLVSSAIHSDEYSVQKEVNDWVARRAYVRELSNERALHFPETYMLAFMFDYMKGSYGQDNIPRAKAAAIYMENIGKAEGISDAFFADYPIDEASVERELAWLEAEIQRRKNQ